MLILTAWIGEPDDLHQWISGQEKGSPARSKKIAAPAAAVTRNVAIPFRDTRYTSIIVVTRYETRSMICFDIYIYVYYNMYMYRHNIYIYKYITWYIVATRDPILVLLLRWPWSLSCPRDSEASLRGELLGIWNVPHVLGASVDCVATIPYWKPWSFELCLYMVLIATDAGVSCSSNQYREWVGQIFHIVHFRALVEGFVFHFMVNPSGKDLIHGWAAGNCYQSFATDHKRHKSNALLKCPVSMLACRTPV